METRYFTRTDDLWRNCIAFAEIGNGKYNFVEINHFKNPIGFNEYKSAIEFAECAVKNGDWKEITKEEAESMLIKTEK